MHVCLSILCQTQQLIQFAHVQSDGILSPFGEVQQDDVEDLLLTTPGRISNSMISKRWKFTANGNQWELKLYLYETKINQQSRHDGSARTKQSYMALLSKCALTWCCRDTTSAMLVFHWPSAKLYTENIEALRFAKSMPVTSAELAFAAPACAGSAPLPACGLGKHCVSS